MITVGLVGFGLSGRRLQAPFFIINPNFRLKAVVTSQHIGGELFDETQKIESFEALLSDPEIDLISICSPSHTHFEYAKRALIAGKHVLVEKPMSPTSTEARELTELAEKVNKVLMVYQNRRFDGDFMTVRQLIQSGVLGELLSYEARWHRYNPILSPKPWKEKATPANGLLYDLGAHLIDQSIYLFGSPKSVSGQAFIQREHSAIDDAFYMNLDYGKLKVRLSASLLVKEFEPRYVLHGTKGSFVKSGFDAQEDQLRAGRLPGTPGYGFESPASDGKLTTNLNGLEMKGTVSTLQGNWMKLFDNLADVILNGAGQSIKNSEIIEQIAIIEKVTRT